MFSSIHLYIINQYIYAAAAAAAAKSLQSCPLPMGFSRQEYWSGLQCPPPGDLSDPGIKPTSLISSASVGRFFTTSATWEAHKASEVPANASDHVSLLRV